MVFWTVSLKKYEIKIKFSIILNLHCTKLHCTKSTLYFTRLEKKSCNTKATSIFPYILPLIQITRQELKRWSFMIPLLRVVAKKELANLNHDSQIRLNHLHYFKVLISNWMNLYLKWLSPLMRWVRLPLLKRDPDFYVVPTLKRSVKNLLHKSDKIWSL